MVDASGDIVQTQSCGTNDEYADPSDPYSIDELLSAFAQIDSPLLDLSYYKLTKVPAQLLSLSHIEYLYLCNNQLKMLPDNFFACLPNLKWLDMRYNRITAIPKSIATARKLVSLLLGNNCLQFLPVEMGSLKTLQSLNLGGNSLQFPPPHVIERGMGAIVKCLKQTEAILAQSELDLDSLSVSDPNTTTQILEEMTQLHFHSILSDSSDDETVGGMKSSQRGSNLGHSMTGGMVRGGFYANTSSYSAATGTKIHSNGANLQQQHNFNRSHSLKQRNRRPSDEWAELDELRPRSASLQKRKDFADLKKEKNSRIEKAGASGRLDTASRMAKEVQDAKLREFNNKIATEEQKMKDKMQLDGWRQDLRDVQRRNYYKPKEPPSQMLSRTENSPYAVEKKHLKFKNRRNMYKEDDSNKTAAMKNMISEEAKKEIELARAARDADLEKRIKLHTLNIQRAAADRKRGRRSNTFSRPNSANNVSLTIEEAKRDLDKALQLQRELHTRQTDLSNYI